MTAPSPAPDAATAEPAPVQQSSPDARPRGKKPRPWLWVVAGVVIIGLLVLVVALFRPQPDYPSTPLDPGNPGPLGAMAVASVIDDHGGSVEVVRGEKQLRNAVQPGSNTTVVVTHPVMNSESAAVEFSYLVRDARRIVLLDPSSTAFTNFGLSVDNSYGTSGTGQVRAGCSADGIHPGDRASGHDVPFVTTDTQATVCFSEAGASKMVILPATSYRPELVLLTGDIVSNDALASADNAGIVIRTLAPTDQVLWYVGSDSDFVAPPTGKSTDIPRAIAPLIGLAMVGLLVLMLWRGRRFGPLATEPLPAVVKAVETTQARGRLYHRAQAADRAADPLRRRTATRIARYLGIPVVSDPESPAAGDFVDAIAEAAHSDWRDVWNLLLGPLPTTDQQLVDFTTALTALEKEVLRTQ